MGGRPVFPNRGGDYEMAQTETPQAAAPPTVTLTQDQLNQLLAAAAAGNQGGLTAESLASAFAKAQRPENTTAPQVSYYNPRGERDVPRPTFKARKVTQNGLELSTDTLTWEEIEAVNALPPGDWRVTKADGTRTAFKVGYVRGLDETTIERMEIHFPCRDEQRDGHRGLFDYCVEVVEQSGNAAEAERLLSLRKTLNKERVAAKVA